jgi:hypothetical protein
MKISIYELWAIQSSVGRADTPNEVYTDEAEAREAAAELTRIVKTSFMGKKVIYSCHRLEDILYDVREDALAEGEHRGTNPDDTWW